MATVVTCPRHAPVLPAAALPVLRASTTVLATADVPAEIVDATGAVPWDGTDPATLPNTTVLLATAAGRAAPDAAPDDVADGPPTSQALQALRDRGDPCEDVVECRVTGAGVLDAVAVMDRLRSPGGCPWDAEQTHASLLRYLVEECYELYQAIEDGDRAEMREELGDVLLQVLFHARVAAEADAEAFDVDDVATGLVDKLVGRHPHVFTERSAGGASIDTVGEAVTSADAQDRRWDEIKRSEKQRESSVDGVATGQPAVALAAKLASRTAKAGLPADLLPAGDGPGESLFRQAAASQLGGGDPEAELRTVARGFDAAVRAAERSAVADGLDPHALTADDWRHHWPTPTRVVDP